jgi:group II intron reverse transcriptase/maturase
MVHMNKTNVKPIIPSKLLSLSQWCVQNPTKVVDRSLYSIMLDPRMFEIAYAKLKSKPGNMTPGIVPTTLDGMSLEFIKKTIQDLQNESFQFSPGRRILIPKYNGGKRPLTIGNPRDKIVQEIIRMILEVIFEPTFSDSSHGFRKGRSCHTALRDIKRTFSVATWYIEGDISKCFDSISHNKLMAIIESKILDRKFTNLIWKTLRTGYFEFRYFQHSITGTPQGSVISPILSNIFLDKLDKFIISKQENFNIGTRVRPWSHYTKLRYSRIKSTDKLKSKKILKKMQLTSYGDPFDPNFKRLLYVRYADDWIIGIRGSKLDATLILDEIEVFLSSELGLILNREKSTIIHSSIEKAMFLGTLISKSHHRQFSKLSKGQKIRSVLNIRFEAPLKRITKKLTEAGFIKGGQPYPRFLWLHNSKDEIISLYNSVINGYRNYYSFVNNYSKFIGWIYKNLRSSCGMLLAAKFTLGSQNKVYRKFGKFFKGNDKIGLVKITYKSTPWAFKINQIDIIKALYMEHISAASLNELSCSVCGSKYRIEMHHIRKMSDLNPKVNSFDRIMISRQRKQIPVCRECHLKIHHS